MVGSDDSFAMVGESIANMANAVQNHVAKQVFVQLGILMRAKLSHQISNHHLL
jgi:hypothetical protein